MKIIIIIIILAIVGINIGERIVDKQNQERYKNQELEEQAKIARNCPIPDEIRNNFPLGTKIEWTCPYYEMYIDGERDPNLAHQFIYNKDGSLDDIRIIRSSSGYEKEHKVNLCKINQ